VISGLGYPLEEQEKETFVPSFVVKLDGSPFLIFGISRD